LDDFSNFTPKDWTDMAERNLYQIANGAEGMQQKLDKDGVVHDLRYIKPPDADVNKFILKNMSKGKWVDRTEVTSTQINVNLTTSYEEVNRILEEQKQQIIEAEYRQIEGSAE